MITPKEIAEKTMNPEKKKTAKNDFFAFYVGRPLSYVLTIPFLYTNISPNTISLLSIIPIIMGFVVMCFARSQTGLVIGWLMFFLWNLLDGVDGNVARYKKQFTRMGSVYDAMSGYIAMVLSFFAWGIAAAHNPGFMQKAIPLPDDLYIVLGALSGVLVIFPRFIMHKAITDLGSEESLGAVKNKSEYGVAKLIALNLTSAAGFVQVIMLVSIIIHALDLFTLGYFILNLMICVMSLHSVLTVYD